MQSIEKGEQALEFESILKRVPLGQAQISLEEIKEVYSSYFSLDNSKAPGPDRFSMCFFHKCWDNIKADLVPTLFGVLPDAFF